MGTMLCEIDIYCFWIRRGSVVAVICGSKNRLLPRSESFHLKGSGDQPLELLPLCEKHGDLEK